MALEPDKELLALELRDASEASVCFSLLELHTNTLLFDRYAFDEEWWMSLLTIKDNLLLIKQYHDSQQPEKQGLLAINIDSMEVQWWLEHFQLLDIRQQTVSGKWHEQGESAVRHFDIFSGKEVNDGLAEANSNEAVHEQVKYPVHYDSESPHFQTVKSFIASHFNILAVGACDYLEIGDFIIVSWFFQEGGSYANMISVMDSEGEIVLEEKIGTGLDAFAADTFFVLKNRLIFVSNKTQLLVYELFEGV